MRELGREKVDIFIQSSQLFAQPILNHFRDLVLENFPDVEEAIKWGMPHWVYRGKNLCAMGAFKQHCAIVLHAVGDHEGASSGGLSHYAKIHNIAEMPDDALLIQRLADMAALIDAGVKKRNPKAPPKPALALPVDFSTAIAADGRAQSHFDSFTIAQRSEYIAWVEGAKRPETRARRIKEAYSWIAEGKRRNWKYANC